MISGNRKDFLASDLLSEFRRSCLWTNTEISKEVKDVVCLYTIVQAFEDRLIHLLNTFKGAVAIPNDVLVPQMKICGEPDVVHRSALQLRYVNEYSMLGDAVSKAIRIDAAGPIASSGDDRPWTVRQAAQFLGVSPQTVYLWVERKQIPHLRVMGRNIRFLRSDLESFRASFRQDIEAG